VIAEKGKNWRERKVHTIELIRGAGHNMKLLSCADKLANIRDIIRDYDRLGEDVWDIFNAPKDSHAWYYGSTLEAFAVGDGSIGDTEHPFDALYLRVREMQGRDYDDLTNSDNSFIKSSMSLLTLLHISL